MTFAKRNATTSTVTDTSTYAGITTRSATAGRLTALTMDSSRWRTVGSVGPLRSSSVTSA
jgi:hypothetical protein